MTLLSVHYCQVLPLLAKLSIPCSSCSRGLKTEAICNCTARLYSTYLPDRGRLPNMSCFPNSHCKCECVPLHRHLSSCQCHLLLLRLTRLSTLATAAAAAASTDFSSGSSSVPMI